MAQKILRIATRRSPLAMWQAVHIQAELEKHFPEVKVELLPMATKGDKILDTPLAKIGGKGLFVKELEHCLLNGEADLAVHSMKDVPMEFPEGLGLSVICERHDPRDAFVSNRFDSIEDMPAGAIVGTSSLRRQCQLRAARPDLTVRWLRGNVNTRLKKLDDGEYDAIILAASGLKRLGFADRIRSEIDDKISLPAGGQGALGIEIRSGDQVLHDMLQVLHHQTSHDCVTAERAMNRRLNGGCQVPIACYAEITGDNQLWLRGLVGSADGKEILRAQATAERDQAEALGIEVAEALLAQGADRILAEVYDQGL